MNTFANGVTGKAISWATEMVRRGRFELCIRKFKRTYPDAAEKERRFAIFCKRIDFINKFHAKERMVTGPRCRLGLNQFFDMTHEEIVGNYCGRRQRAARSRANEAMANEVSKRIPSLSLNSAVFFQYLTFFFFFFFPSAWQIGRVSIRGGCY